MLMQPTNAVPVTGGEITQLIAGDTLRAMVEHGDRMLIARMLGCSSAYVGEILNKWDDAHKYYPALAIKGVYDAVLVISNHRGQMYKELKQLALIKEVQPTITNP